MVFQLPQLVWGQGDSSYRIIVRWLALAAVLFLAGSDARAGGRAVEGVLNLNTAPAELLTLLPGIGPAKARAILSYRARRPFRTVDELVRVRGIGRRMVREMRAHLAVVGPSTARGAERDVLVESLPPVRLMAPAPPPTRPTSRPAPGPLRVRLSGRLPAVRSPANHCALSP